MAHQRKGLFEHQSDSARARLDEMWRQSMQLMLAGDCSMLDDQIAELHEKIC